MYHIFCLHVENKEKLVVVGNITVIRKSKGKNGRMWWVSRKIIELELQLLHNEAIASNVIRLSCSQLSDFRPRNPENMTRLIPHSLCISAAS